MYVSSENFGTISLSCEFSDPLCCTYVCEDTALDPQEMKWRKHAHRLSVRKCHRSALLHSVVWELLR